MPAFRPTFQIDLNVKSQIFCLEMPPMDLRVLTKSIGGFSMTISLPLPTELNSDIFSDIILSFLIRFTSFSSYF